MLSVHAFVWLQVLIASSYSTMVKDQYLAFYNQMVLSQWLEWRERRREEQDAVALTEELPAV